MKNLFLSFLLLFGSFFVNAQSYYKATLTELYTYNAKEDTWDLYQKNSDVNITIVVEEEYINIQAQSPSFFKIILSTKQAISTTNFTGYRYVAKDLKKETYMKVDILNHKGSEYIVLSIIDNDTGFNFRYFLYKIK